jgi:hypothetical protein
MPRRSGTISFRNRIDTTPSTYCERTFSMIRFTTLATLAATACIAVATPAVAQTRQEEARFAQAQQRLDTELQNFRTEYDRYQQARARGGSRGGYNDPRGSGYNDPRGGTYYEDDRDEAGYDPARYYREGPTYRERVLAADDRVYRGNDGRYYCKRSDGTTGLIIGAAGGGILGNVIDGGRSRTVGTLLGAALGAVAGRAVDQNNQQVRCR